MGPVLIVIRSVLDIAYKKDGQVKEVGSEEENLEEEEKSWNHELSAIDDNLRFAMQNLNLAKDCLFELMMDPDKMDETRDTSNVARKENIQDLIFCAQHWVGHALKIMSTGDIP